jgi:hypothetical protein
MKATVSEMNNQPDRCAQDWKELDEQPNTICCGGSTLMSALGKVLAGPLYDRDGIL